jgi:hypothetical protein
MAEDAKNDEGGSPNGLYQSFADEEKHRDPK